MAEKPFLPSSQSPLARFTKPLTGSPNFFLALAAASSWSLYP
jgi:hypothetical protein